MSRMLFANLPVRDVTATRKFFDGLGFEFNDQFCDEQTACMVVNDHAMVMLMEEQRFHVFISDDICDTAAAREVLLCVSADSREEVDSLLDRALAGGGSVWMQTHDNGVMYSRAFRDLDGHVWEAMWMDPRAIQG